MFSLLKLAAVTAAGFYLFLCLLVYVWQDRLIYFPVRGYSFTPDQRGLDFERVELKTSDSVGLAAWFIPAREGEGGVSVPRRTETWDGVSVPRRTVLFCHGNGGNMTDVLDFAEAYRNLGWNTLLFDYRGYGDSEGQPTEEGTYRDAEAAWGYLVDVRGIEPEDILVVGFSLGGPIAARLASLHTPKGLVLQSTFTSLGEMAALHYSIFPVRLLARYRYPTVEYLEKVECPVMVLHGELDEVIPYRFGKVLFDSARGHKVFFDIPGTHADGIIEPRGQYAEAFRDFTERLIPARKP